MAEIPLKQNECPTREQLSAYFDKESSNPACIEQHLKSCQNCRAYFETLARIDYSIKHAVDQEVGTDEDISARILARVKASVKEEPPVKKYRFYLSPVQWRAASLLLIAGLLGYFIWDETKSERAEPYLPKRIDRSANVPAVLSSLPSKPVQISDLTKVNFTFGEHTLPESEKQAYLPIKEYVRHVWRIPADNSGEQFEKLIAAGAFPEKSITKTENGWELSLKNTKLEIVKLVKKLSDSGFLLMSPDQPQPEQKAFLGKAEEVIIYKAVFVKKK